MSKEGKGKVIQISSARTRYISIPADVAGDDRFPFDIGEEVLITIEEPKKRLIVEKRK